MKAHTTPLLHPSLLIALLLAATALAGCSHDGGDADDDGSAPSGMQLVFAEHPELGSILVDNDGMTLYIFENDDPGKSNCFDSCAQNWPPLLATEVPDGPEKLNLGLIDREGEQQVTQDDQPLYYFAQDQAPGDANGEGAGDVWYVIRESEL